MTYNVEYFAADSLEDITVQLDKFLKANNVKPISMTSQPYTRTTSPDGIELVLVYEGAAPEDNTVLEVW